MFKFFNRQPIGRKIIGLVACALGLMVAIAAYNQYLEVKQADEITDLTEYLTPVAVALARIEIHVVEQDMHYERALRMVREKRGDDKVDAEIAKFSDLTKKVDAELKLASDGLEASLARVKNIQDAVSLARIQPILPIIAKEHMAYHGTAMQLLAQARGQVPEMQIDLGDDVARREDVLDEVLGKTASEIGLFVEQQGHLVHEYQERRMQSMLQGLGITSAAFIAALLLAVLITRRLVAPIRRLTSSANAVAQGDLTVDIVPATTHDEVGSLTTAFRDMVQGLKEKESIKQTFSTYVDPRVVRRLLDTDNSDIAGDRREMTVFFSDIAGFTGVSEKLTPQSLVRLINAYLAEMSQPIAQYEGVIDKFIGDAIMAYWGPPFVGEHEHARLAVRAALLSFEVLDKFRTQIPEITGMRTGAPDINIRIGLATGPVVIGNMGSKTFKNYTIMGDTVNLASRMEGACSEYGIRFLIVDSTRALLGGEVLLREIDLLQVKGKTEPVRVFQPLCLADAATAEMTALVARHNDGVTAYRAQDWDAAEAAFEAVQAASPQDGPARVFLKRIALLRQHPPGAGWDGVWRMTSK